MKQSFSVLTLRPFVPSYSIIRLYCTRWTRESNREILAIALSYILEWRFCCRSRRLWLNCWTNARQHGFYLTVILRGRADELITNEAVGLVGYYQLISGNSEKNNCFNKFSSNSLDFFGWNLLKSWHFLYRRRRENIFSDLQNFSTRNSPSVFPYLVKLNDNGSYHGLREPIRKLESHYPELKIY